MSEIKKVLFICQANVGRSQMAEGFYNHLTSSKHASSAAIKDRRKEYNSKPSQNIINLMREVGIDISSQRIKLVTEDMLDKVDLVVVLCEQALCLNFIVNNPKTIFKEIEDPYQRDIDTMRRIRDQIQALVQEIIATYN